ncbi:MAG: hypothetical protein ACYDFT_07460 [Thermoplasmata archaeon]
MKPIASTVAQILGTVLVFLGLSNIISAFYARASIAPSLGPGIALIGIGTILWRWAIRSARGRSESAPSAFWLVVGKVLGTLLALYGIGDLAIFILVGKPGLAVGSVLIFVGSGTMLWVWSLYAGRARPSSPSASIRRELAVASHRLGGPDESPANAVSPLTAAALNDLYGEVEQEGKQAYYLVRSLGRRMAYANLCLLAAVGAVTGSIVVVFGVSNLLNLAILSMLAALFGFIAWSSWRRFDWLGSELAAGRSPQRPT